jgi:8-oxo-dGTP pyrophosphatase MutT (NUDIX family)
MLATGKKSFIRVRVTVILRREDGRICFVRHVKDGQTYWLLPGGGQKPFESLEEACRRELMEELGITTGSLRLICLRESYSAEAGRHIQFPIFVGENPDFSQGCRSQDPRVVGADFYLPGEFGTFQMYPTIQDDLAEICAGRPVELFRTVPWIP